MTEQATETPAELLERIATTARMIAVDAEADAAKYDGKAMTGRDLGELHGEHCAYIHALAGMVEKLANLVRDDLVYPRRTITLSADTFDRSPAPDMVSVMQEAHRRAATLAFAQHPPNYPPAGATSGPRVCLTCGTVEEFHP